MTLILVDASYNSFYRFFATMRWYSFAHKNEFKKVKDDPKYDWSSNDIFREKYEKMYFDSIEKLLTKKVIENSIVIFCEDVEQSTLWRHKLILSKEDNKQYKGERPDLKSKYNFTQIFKDTYKKLIPKIIKEKNFPVYQLKFDETEADDIIAIICLYFKERDRNKDIIIVSGDDDFTQLGRTNVSILDYRKKMLKTYDENECKEKLRLKIIMGDKSDNIPSIFPKSRKEVSLKQRNIIKESKEEMKTFLKNNKEIRERYELNEKLINFRKIPKRIQIPVIKKIKKLNL